MNLFCIVFGLDKNLTLTKSNKFVFVSLNRFFTLSLQKIIIQQTLINKYGNWSTMYGIFPHTHLLSAKI